MTQPGIHRRLAHLFCAVILEGVTLLSLPLSTAHATSDLAILNIETSPRTLTAGEAPSRFILTVTNKGPDDFIADASPLILHYTLSPLPDEPTAPGSRILTETPIVVYGTRIPASATVEYEFDPVSLSDLAIPPDLVGDQFLYVLILSLPPNTDPEISDNILQLPDPFRIRPAPSSARHLFFTKDDFSESNKNSTPFHKDLHLLDSSDFAFNHAYGNSWRLTRTGGFFRCSFESESDRDLALWVRHLASYAANAENNGESAITILLNGEPVTQRFKIAQAHGGTHAYVNDSWAIRARPGTNILEWRADNLHTHYWIQSIMIGDPFRLALTRAEPDRFTLRLSGTLPFPATLDATPSIKEGWIPFHHLQPADLTPAGMILTVTNLMPAQFFRLRANPALPSPDSSPIDPTRPRDSGLRLHAPSRLGREYHLDHDLGACLEVERSSVFAQRAGGPGATKDPTRQRSVTEEPRRQPALCAKTLRATCLLGEPFVGSTVIARCGDAPVSPPRPLPKSRVAGPLSLFGQTLSSTL